MVLTVTRVLNLGIRGLRNLRMDIRPLSLRQPVRIKSSDLILPSPRPVYDGVPYLYVWDNVNWQVEYENTMRTPMSFTYEQQLDGVLDSTMAYLLGRNTVKVSTPLEIASAKTLSASAKVIILKRTVDSVTKGFDIGTLQYKEKSMTEYPVTGPWGEVYNTDLSERFGGYEGYKSLLSQMYKPDPNFIVESLMEVRGAVPFEGIYYRPPLGTLTVYVTFKVTNKSSVNKPINIFTPTPIVIYEDRVHATRLVGLSKGIFTISPGENRTFTYGQSIPKWMYGTVLVWSDLFVSVPPYVLAEYPIFAEYKIGDMFPPS